MPYADPTAISATGMTLETSVNVYPISPMSPTEIDADMRTVMRGRSVPSIVWKLKYREMRTTIATRGISPIRSLIM